MKLKLQLLMAGILGSTIGIATIPLGVLAAHASGPSNTMVVQQADLAANFADAAAHPKKWFMYNDTTDKIDNTLGSFVAGPATPPNGIGSLKFILGADPLDRKNIATYQYGGTALSAITKLSFGAYSHNGSVGAGATESPYFNFNADFTGSGTTFQKRLVYVPSANGAVPQDTWNTYDTINGGNAKWNYSGANWPATLVGPDKGAVLTPGTTTRTWKTILADYPNVRVLPTNPWLGVRVGEPGPTGYTGNVDSFTLGTAVGTTTSDFEPTVTSPTTKDQCKNAGWKTFNSPSFRNQGKCVSFVNKHSHKIRGDIDYTANGLKRSAEFKMNTADNNGTFEYSDANHDSYKVKVSSVSVKGASGYFAGVVTEASNPSWVGQWLFAKVKDNHPDQVWGDFTTQAVAEAGVTAMSDPSSGPFDVTAGNLVVK